MSCASCSRKTLAVFIDSVLCNGLQNARITQPRLPRPGFALQTRQYHRTPTRHHDASLKALPSYRADDAYVPFDSMATSDYTLAEQIDAASLPGPFTKPPAPEPTADMDLAAEDANDFEPDITLQGDLRNEEPASPRSDKNNAAIRRVDHTRRPADRMQRKERNRDKIAARRRARTQDSSDEALPEPAVLAKEFEELSTKAQMHPRQPTTPKSPKMKADPISKAASPAKGPKLEAWRAQKLALQAKFQEEGWNPRKRLSPEALEGIRALHTQYPEHFNTPALAEHFKVSPEAIRRILKSKWRPNEEEEQKRLQRWDRRGESIWTQKVKEGVHPPKRWREMGIGGGPRRRAQDRLRGQRARSNQGDDEAPDEHAWIGSLAAGMA